MMRRQPTTHWSCIAKAGDLSSPESRAALTELYETYCPALYALARRAGSAPEEASDQTQGFFAELLRRNDLADVHPERGRFRSWLRVSFQNYLKGAWIRKKRDATVSFDADAAEAGYAAEPATQLTPEKHYTRQWVVRLLARNLRALEVAHDQRGDPERFRLLRDYLVPGSDASGLVEKLGTSPEAARVALCRLRQEFYRLVRADIADTVMNPGEIDGEIHDLLSSLSDEAG